MQPAIPLAHAAGGQVRRQPVLLDPVDLEVAERLPVEAADDGDGVAAGEACRQKRALVGDGPILAPAVADARQVHPLVQQLDVGHECAVVGGAVLEVEGAKGGDAGLAVLGGARVAHVVAGAAEGGRPTVDAGRFLQRGDPKAQVLA